MILIIFFLINTFALAQNGCPAETDGPKYAPPKVAKGFTARVVISGLLRPRGMVFDTEGNLLVVQNRKEITAFSMANDSGCVKVTGKSMVVNGSIKWDEGVGSSQSKLDQVLKLYTVEPWNPTYS
jgi:hypothetical protein